MKDQASEHEAEAGGEIIRAVPAVLEPPNGHFVTEQEGKEKHPLLIWTSLTPGNVVSLRVAGTWDHVGTIEASTSDGLIIWIRDELNERKLYHFRDCQSVRLVR